MASIFNRIKDIALSAYHGIAPNFIDHGQGWTSQGSRPQQPPPRPATPPIAPPKVQNAFTPNLKPVGFQAPPPIKVAKPPNIKVGKPSLASRLFHNITHNPVTNATGTAVVKPGAGAAKSTGIAIKDIVQIPYDVGRTIPASVTNNKVALAHANTAANSDIKTAASFAQFLPRSVVQLSKSGAHVINPRGPNAQSFTPPKTGLSHALLGDQPIQTLQDVYKSTKQAQGTQAAVGNTALTALMDVLAVKGGKDSVHNIVAKTPHVIEHARNLASTPLNEAGGIRLPDAAAKHPAVQALDEHLQNLNTLRGNLVARNAPQNAIKANDLAYKATLQAKNDTVKQINQGGYVSFKGSDSLDPAAYRAEITKRMNAEADHFDKNYASIKAGSGTNTEYNLPGRNKMIAGNKRMFKEFRKDPNAFIDRYNLLPPEVIAKEKGIAPTEPTGWKPIQEHYGIKSEKSAPKTSVNPASSPLTRDSQQFIAHHLKGAGVDTVAMHPIDQAELAKIIDESHKVAPNAPTTPEHISQTIEKMAKQDTTKQISEGGYAKVPESSKGNIVSGGTTVYHGGAGVDEINKNGAKILTPEQKLKYPSSGGGYVGLSTTADKNYAKQFSQNIAGHNNVAELKISPTARIHELPRNKAIDDMSANELTALSKKYDVIKSVQDNEYRILNEEGLAQPTQVAKPFNSTPPPRGDIATIAEIDRLQSEGKPIPPELKQKAGIELTPSEKATAIQQENKAKGMALAGSKQTKPAGARISDSEWESLIKSGANLEPTTYDKIIANAGGDASAIAAEGAKKQMYHQADSHAWNFLDAGGNKNTAIDLYRKETGATDKMATYRVNQVITALNLRKAPPSNNPLSVELPTVKAGDYQKARGNVQLATSHINIAGQQVINAVERLKKGERKQFADFVEHPEDMTAKTSQDMRDAVSLYRDLANRVHATSQALGGETPYRSDYYNHLVDLGDKTVREKYMAMAAKKNPSRNPEDFVGLNRMPRVFNDIRELHKAGFNLKHEGNPAKQIAEYTSSAISQLRKQALVKGFTEADLKEPKKLRNFDLKNGQTINLSDKGMQEIKNFDRNPLSKNKAVKGYRGLNRFLKRTLLSISQFHTINVNALQAAPSLIGTPKDVLMGESHPVLAARGLVGSARALFDTKYADRTIQGALKDGTIDFAARVGTPISYGSDFSTGSGLLAAGKAGIGEKAVFGRQLPVMHIAMVRGLRADLERRNISADSVDARKSGLMVNRTMAYVNQELENFDPRGQRGLSDVMLAPQFTRTKWELMRDAIGESGKAGNLARRAVIGKYTAEAALILGLSYAVHQKSDNIKDMLLRALVHPSVPTPWKDKKGNTIEVGLPQNYISEAASLGITLKRGKNGRLGLDFGPENIPGNVESYGRSRLAVLPAAGLKLRTNTNYAGKPLYDPNAPAGTKAIQAGTTITGDLLPIATQGLAQENVVKKRLPGSSQEILDANNPGTRAIVKSVASSFGGTVRSDKTVGKSKDTTAYFNALDEAGKGLNRQEKDAFDLYTGSKKNPVTGKYAVMPSVNDSRARATVLLQNPKVIDKVIEMNKQLSGQGQKVDPLWTQSKENITKYLQYQAMPPHGPDQKDWHNKNDEWYRPLATARNKFFDSLPPGDPNKPKAPLEYPEPTGTVKDLMNQYYSFSNSAARANFMKIHPEIEKQFAAQDGYYNSLRSAQGYAKFKGHPVASPQVQKFIDTYLAADKATRKNIRNANPAGYKAMSAYFDKADLYGIDTQGAVSALQGEPDTTPKELKQIAGLAKDIYTMPDGSQQLVPAGWTMGLSNGGLGFSSNRKGAKVHTPTPRFRHLKLKRTTIKPGADSANQQFNAAVKGIGIKPGGSNKIKIAS